MLPLMLTVMNRDYRTPSRITIKDRVMAKIPCPCVFLGLPATASLALNPNPTRRGPLTILTVVKGLFT